MLYTQNKITTFWLCFLCACVLMFMSCSQRKYIFHNGKDLLIRSCIWIWRWGFYLSLSQKLYGRNCIFESILECFLPFSVSWNTHSRNFLYSASKKLLNLWKYIAMMNITQWLGFIQYSYRGHNRTFCILSFHTF